MTATETPPKETPKTRPIWSFTRRLGVQAVMSVTVMAGLQIASVNGFDVRDLLPAPESEAAGPEAPTPEPARIAGIPVRFDLPVQAGSALERILPKPPAEEIAAVAEKGGPAAPESPAKAALPTPAPLMAALPKLDRVAVPSPRPRLASARPAAVPPQPSEASFDLSPRDVEIYAVSELVREDAPPVPIQAQDGFRVGDLVPSGSAILTRTAELSGTAAHVVTGTATRLLDLAR